MKRFLALTVAAVLATATPASAAATVTKAWYQYAAYQYTVTADAGTFTASPRDGTPLTTGGCVNVYRKLAGVNRYQNTVCSTLGTIRFTSPKFPACETVFNIYLDGVVFYTDQIGATCPPPPPPAVEVVVDQDAGTVTFHNPATIAQGKTADLRVDSASELLYSPDPFTYRVDTRFASSGPNTYVYFMAVITVTLAPGQTILVTDATPGVDLAATPLPSGTVYCALHATKGGHGCLKYGVAP